MRGLRRIIVAEHDLRDLGGDLLDRVGPRVPGSCGNARAHPASLPVSSLANRKTDEKSAEVEAVGIEPTSTIATGGFLQAQPVLSLARLHCTG